MREEIFMLQGRRRLIVGFVGAVAATYLLGAVLSTAFIMSSLTGMGVALDIGERISWLLHDLVGMAPAYGIVIALAFGIALPIAERVARIVPNWRNIGLVAAGALAVIATHLIMRMALELTGLPATRTALGLMAQGLAGAVGGYAFGRLVPAPAMQEHAA
jgi:hypothetical protein